MHSSTLIPTVLLALSASVSALAVPQLFERSDKSNLNIPLPDSGLPAPSTVSPAVNLKYIVLGVGTQNYTCASTPNSAGGNPVSVGAKAALYNAGPFLQNHEDMVESLPGLALSYKSMTGRDVSPSLGLSSIGQHFFNAAGQPTFELTAVKARLVAKRLNGVAAPPDACPGPDGAGAVDWLQLTDVGGGASFGGITYVYREETAGGKPPGNCANQSGAFQVQYASEYWFYGP
jgi:hypothetical protein